MKYWIAMGRNVNTEWNYLAKSPIFITLLWAIREYVKRGWEISFYKEINDDNVHTHKIGRTE